MSNGVLSRSWVRVILVLVFSVSGCGESVQEDTQLKSLAMEHGILLSEIVQGNSILDDKIDAVIQSSEEIAMLIESDSLTVQQAEEAVRKATVAMKELNQATENLLAMDTESPMQKMRDTLVEVRKNPSQIDGEDIDVLIGLVEQLEAWSEETARKGAVANRWIAVNKDLTKILMEEARDR